MDNQSASCDAGHVSCRWEVVCIALLLVVAVATRLLNFWEAPFLGFVDIGAHAEATLKLQDRLREGEIVPPWELGWGNVPHFYWYTLFPFVEILEPPILGQKIATIAFSLLALCITYLFLRDLGGPLLALLGIQMLVFSRYFLFYSRYPMEPVDLYLFFILALYLFRRGLLARSTLVGCFCLLFSALSLAAGQHIYLSGRVLIPLFPIYFSIPLLTRKDLIRPWLRGTIFFCAFIVFMIPLAQEYAMNQEALTVRHREIGVLGSYSPHQIAANFWRSFTFFIYTPDPAAGQNLVTQPMVQPAIVALFVIGLCATPFLLKREPILLSVALFLLCLPATALTIEPANSKRLLNAMLAVVILAAYPATLWVASLRRQRRNALWIPILVSIAVIGFGVHDWKILFEDFNQDRRSLEGTGYPQVKYAETVVELSGKSDLHISPNRSKPQAASFHPDIQPPGFNLAQHIPYPLEPEKDVVFLLEDKQTDLLPLLQHFYPTATQNRIEFNHGYGFQKYTLPASEVRASFGVLVSSSSGDALLESSLPASWHEDTLGIEFPETASEVQIEGLVYCDGFFGIGFEGHGQIEVELDGEPISIQRVFGSASVQSKVPVPGWREWKLVFRPTRGQRDCLLVRSRKGNAFVAATVPPGAFRCLAFSDLSGLQAEAMSFVPTNPYYNYFSGHPKQLAAYWGEVDAPRGGEYIFELRAESNVYIELNQLIRESLPPMAGYSKPLKLEPGRHAFLMTVEMQASGARVPNFGLNLTPAEPGIPPVQWFPQGQSVKQVLELVRSIRSADMRSAPVEIIDYGQAWGRLEMNRSVENRPLKVAGTGYHTGLGTHASSRITIRVPEGKQRFRALVGVDDESGTKGTVVFRILDGGKVLAESPLMRGGEPGYELTAEVK